MAILERTDKLLEELVYCDFRTNVGIDKAKRLIRLALREQDKDTRHACAARINRIALHGDTVVACHNEVMNCNDGI